jgi:uncharacterized repeat protein (TIGR03837 family)
MRWSLFCRVIDNYGDAGFCLRLARELRARGEQVDFYIDDAGPLAWMQAGLPDPVPALRWPGELEQPVLGDGVIEAFGCELPTGVLMALAAKPKPPLWVNLEYLSAESYVERSHGLPSPQQSGPAQGLMKRFCYPGFNAATAGLLHEQGLAAAQRAHDAASWLAGLGIRSREAEHLVSLFCYRGAPLQALLDGLRGQPTLLLVCGDRPLPPLPDGVRSYQLPLLNQRDYDRLLWSCDLNLVRGEDSFVRAQWAGLPMLWQLYPQQDGAHEAKLEAFLAKHGGPTETLPAWRAWNGLAPAARLTETLPALWGEANRRHALQWRDRLRLGPELVDTLLTWSGQYGQRPG